MTRAEQPTVVTPTSGALAADSRERAVRALLRFPPLKRCGAPNSSGASAMPCPCLSWYCSPFRRRYTYRWAARPFGGGYRGAALAVTAVFAARMLATLLFGAVLLGPLSALTAPSRAAGPALDDDRRGRLRLALLVVAPLWIDWTPDDALAVAAGHGLRHRRRRTLVDRVRESAAPGLLPAPPPEGAAVRPLPDNMDALRRLSLRTAFVALPIAAAALVVVTLISKLLGTGIDWFDAPPGRARLVRRRRAVRRLRIDPLLHRAPRCARRRGRAPLWRDCAGRQANGGQPAPTRAVRAPSRCWCWPAPRSPPPSPRPSRSPCCTPTTWTAARPPSRCWCWR